MKIVKRKQIYFINLFLKKKILKAIFSYLTIMDQKKTRYPVIITYNVLKSYYNEYGRAMHDHFRSSFPSNCPGEVVPVVNSNAKSSIESRALYIEKQVKQVRPITREIDHVG